MDDEQTRGGTTMPTATWKPTTDEVRRIVAELAPVIDKCVAKSTAFLQAAAADHERSVAAA
jgi:hypothetical protein